MSQNAKKIRERLLEMLGMKEWPMLSGKCKGVDEEKGTMKVELNDSLQIIEDVLLNALDGEADGITIIPEDDTDVIIASVDAPGEYVLISAGKIKKVIVKSTEISVECENVVFNGGDNKGLVKVKELTDKVNNLEDLVNNLLSTLQGVIIPLAPSGTYPFAPLFTQTPLTPTQQADIENDKIKY